MKIDRPHGTTVRITFSFLSCFGLGKTKISSADTNQIIQQIVSVQKLVSFTLIYVELKIRNPCKQCKGH